MKLSLTSLQPDWMIKTSSSRTDSAILTLVSPLENFLTVTGTRGTLSLSCHFNTASRDSGNASWK
jgi:hypothetical protein